MLQTILTFFKKNTNIVLLLRGSEVRGMEKNGEILHSWKEISQYLERDIRTLLRWRKNLGLPVFRIDEKSPRSKVFAYKSDLDSWLENKAKTKGSKTKILTIGKPWAIGLTVATIILVVAFAYVLVSNFSLSRVGPPQLRVLVIPFEDLNPEDADDSFIAGITNQISQTLEDHNLFQVIRREKPVQYAEEAVLLSSHDDGSDPDYELRGEAGMFGDVVRIRISLTRLSDGTVIFDKDYENALTELSLVQENISSGIFRELVSELESQNLRMAVLTSPQESTRATVGDHDYTRIIKSLENETDVWRLYYMGLHYLRKSTRQSNDAAIWIFNRACEIDPNCAHAYIGLAECYLNYVNFNWDFNLRWIVSAEAMLAQAYSIDPDLPEYYSTSAKILLVRKRGFREQTLEQAFALAEEGLSKYPNHYELNSIQGYCHFARFGNEGKDEDLNKALEFKEKAYWIDPYNVLNINYAEILLLVQDFEGASEICLSLIPHDSTLLAEYLLGQVYYYWGALDKSERIFSKFKDAEEFELRAPANAFLGMIAAQRGEYGKAKKLAQRVRKFSDAPYGNGLKLASIYFGLGDVELGREYLYSFIEEASPLIMKHVEKRYIVMDRNFSGAVDELGQLF